MKTLNKTQKVSGFNEVTVDKMFAISGGSNWDPYDYYNYDVIPPLPKDRKVLGHVKDSLGNDTPVYGTWKKQEIGTKTDSFGFTAHYYEWY